MQFFSIFAIAVTSTALAVPILNNRDATANIAPSPRDETAVKADKLAPFFLGQEHKSLPIAKRDEDGGLHPFFLGAEHKLHSSRNVKRAPAADAEADEAAKLAPFFLGAEHTSPDAKHS